MYNVSPCNSELEKQLEEKNRVETEGMDQSNNVLGKNGMIKEEKMALMVEKTKEVLQLVRLPLSLSTDSPYFLESVSVCEEYVVQWVEYMRQVCDALDMYCACSASVEKASLQLSSLLEKPYKAHHILFTAGEIG